MYKREVPDNSFYAMVMKTMHDAVIATDAGYGITSWNDAAERMYGWTEKEVMGRSSRDILRSHMTDDDVKKLVSDLSVDGIATYETIHHRKDGSQITVEAKLAVLRDLQGEINGYVAANRDISERKRLEEDLKNRQIELESLFNNSNAGLVLFDAKPPYKVLAHNRYYQELFAEPYRTQGMLGKNIFDYAPEIEAQGVVKVFDEVVRTRKPMDLMDFPYDSHPPEKTWFNWHLSPIIQHGEVVALASMSLNVTDRHVAERSLRENEEHLRNLYESMSEGLANHEIVFKDGRAVDYIITNVNPAYERITGLSKTAVVGHKASELYGLGIPPYLEIYARIAMGGEPENFESFFPPMNKHFSISVFSPGRGKFATIFSDITDRKRSEDALRQSQEDMDHAQEVGKIGSWRLDTRANILTWSDENYRIFGVPKGTPLAYETFLDIVHPSDREFVDARWKTGLKGEPYDIEHRILISGEVRWVREKAYLERDPDGNLLGGFGITQDITDRKQAEEDLQRLAQQRQLALDAADLGWWQYNPITDISNWDDRYKEIFGVEGYCRPNAEILTRLHPDDLSRVWAKVDAALDPSDPQSYSAEYRIILPSGKIKWIEAHGIAVFEGEGDDRKALSLIGTVADITERKATQESLKRLSQFPGENPNPVMRCNTDGMILYSNDPANRWLDQFGWKRGNSLPERLAEVVILAYEQVKPIEIEMQDPADRVYYIFAVRPPGEDYINLYVIDITERNKAEVALRTNEERLRSALNEKEILLKEIHHRVKNNMQVISSLIALQAEGSKDAVLRANLLDVTNRVHSMAIVHEQLYQSTDLARVDFAEYARSLLNYLWHSHGTDESNIRLSLDLEPVFFPINEAVPCGLILNELASNALKHAFNGRTEGEVCVHLRHSERGGLCMTVRDNGCGLPVGFDWRHANSLGLRLVQMLTTQLHGTMDVSGGSGTGFTLTFGGKK